MGARLRIFLTREQDRTLLNLKTAEVPQKVKDRAEVIRLNAHGWYVEKIAAHVNWTSQTVREVLHRWEKQGLYIFFLPKYCSQMNPIELEWQHLKKDEIAGQMFDDELELAYAVIDGIQARGERGNYRTQRIKFHSNQSD